MSRLLRRARALLCTILGHPRGTIFTGAGGAFCPSCVRDWNAPAPDGGEGR